MARIVSIWLTIVFSTISIFLTSCESRVNKDFINDGILNEYVVDDTTPLESCLTKEYDLVELELFFNGTNSNENLVFNPEATPLTFSRVDQKFPVEIIRGGGYSVYKVRQGGFFYVFWVSPLVSGQTKTVGEPQVYFSAYLASSVSPSKFDSIKPWESTAKDVKQIDPSVELSFVYSSAIYSFSYIDDGSVLVIEYAYQDGINDYDDLIVKEKRIVERGLADSRYSVILSNDIP